jgi:hypothetical protein
LRYDKAGRPVHVPGVVVDIEYDASGRALHLSNANQTETFRTYSPLRGFLTTIVTQGPMQPPAQPLIQDLTYAYDASGVVQSVSSPVPNEGWRMRPGKVVKTSGCESRRGSD